MKKRITKNIQELGVMVMAKRWGISPCILKMMLDDWMSEPSFKVGCSVRKSGNALHHSVDDEAEEGIDE